MPEQFEGERCSECGYPSGHSPNCPNKESNKEEIKKSNSEEIKRAYWRAHPKASIKEVFIKASGWAKDIEKNRMNLEEAQNYAWKVRREAVSQKARREMGDEGDERDKEILENMIHSGKAEQPTKTDYARADYAADYEKERNEQLEAAREKLKNLK